MGYEEGHIDKDLRPPMDYGGLAPIKTSKTKIKDSSEYLAKN
jgi:hypothetical protein